MTEQKQPAPTPTEVDDLCLAWETAKIAVEEAEKKASAAKAPLLAAVQQHGYIPKGAEKTLRLEGVIYTADSTTGTTIEIVEAQVAELQLELSRARKPRVFGQLFERKVRHLLKKGAADLLKLAIGALADDKQAHLVGIFSRCFSAESKSPTLSVQLCAVLMKKEADAAEKAAKKAAKKGGR